MLGAFDLAAFDEAGGEVGVAVGADAIGGVVGVIVGAIDGEGAFVVVEAEDVFALEQVI